MTAPMQPLPMGWPENTVIFCVVCQEYYATFAQPTCVVCKDDERRAAS